MYHTLAQQLCKQSKQTLIRLSIRVLGLSYDEMTKLVVIMLATKTYPYTLSRIASCTTIPLQAILSILFRFTTNQHRHRQRLTRHNSVMTKRMSVPWQLIRSSSSLTQLRQVNLSPANTAKSKKLSNPPSRIKELLIRTTICRR